MSTASGAERAPQETAPAPRWCLFRVDDNGNEFEMQRFDDELTALAARDDYERRGHKQAYFVRRAD
jgi:hypothetical protein